MGVTLMTPNETTPRDFFRRVIGACRGRTGWKIADTTGAELDGKQLLARAFVLRRLLRRSVLAPEERRVGILLPPTAAAVAANLALTLDRRTTVNLNYTLTAELLNACVAQAGLRHVLTSRRFVEKLGLKLDAELVYLEDFKEAATRRDKAIGGAWAYGLPTGLILRLLGLDRIDDDEVMTVVFTSGSTGAPKGAELTYANIATNAAAVDRVISIRPSDVLIGVLPFFHGFGFTVTLWTALLNDVAAAYHVNPLEAQVVGKLTRERRGTILLGTPMFFRTYARRCEAADFASLEVVVAGGERLTAEVADAFEAKFGIRPTQGYGATEASPMIASNVPPSRAQGDPALSAREGTVGRAMPSVELRIVDRESGEALGPNREGILQARGPNVMKGYLEDPAATARVVRDGWYVTGDIATIDDDGFVRIVGRESRFAKIGGELVPHLAVEEAITAVVGTDEEGGQRAVVVSAADPHAGERLVVVHTPLEQTPAEIVRALAERGLPKLYLPAPNAFVEVEALPAIGVGKLDIKRIVRIAEAAAHRRHGAQVATS
jgi:acyl-[acyl-carrier-protein]-phospholipid O-acyltransferase / long-chain-fatty-acid--[acyl-carrier-protein] ligase